MRLDRLGMSPLGDQGAQRTYAEDRESVDPKGRLRLQPPEPKSGARTTSGGAGCDQVP
jgi:hypothetical protein